MTPIDTDSVRRSISGSGELAHLVRVHDWTHSALGPIDTWSEALLTTVNIVLTSRFPTVLFWGPSMIQIYNDSYCALIADRHPTALGQSAPECWQEAWSTIGAQFESALRDGSSFYEQGVLIPITRHGKLEDVYWSYNCGPVYSPSGEIAGVLHVCHDVTEEILTRRERDEISAQLNRVLDATTDGIVSINRDWRIAYANPQARKVLAPRGEVLGLHIWRDFPGMIYEDSPYVRHYTRAMDDGIPAEFEAFYPEPLNIWFHLYVRPAPDGIVIFFHDITEQKRTENLAREAAVRLDAIYNTSLEYIGLLSTDGKLLDCNRALLEFSNNDREEVLGKSLWETPWFLHTPAAATQLRDAVKRAAKGRHIHYEVTLERPHADSITFDFSLSPVRNEIGEVIFLVPEGRDITLVKKTENALKESEKLAVVGRLAASIAHEINNPLESVTNLLYLSGTSDNLEEMHRYVHTAEQELARVSVITNQTLRFYRQSTSPKIISCNELVEGVLSIHRGRIFNAGVKVKERMRSQEPLHCFDGEIRQVLNNLIGNAIDAMHPQGGTLLIRSRNATDWPTRRAGVMLTIADSGSGISPANRRKIFEPFFTTKGHAGTGLGLWVTQEIVARHQGTLHLRTSQNPTRHGTVFALFLPTDTPPLDATQSPVN